MREIKFKGYNIGIAKWIYGCLVKYWSKVKEDFVDDGVMIVSQNTNNYYEVDKDSIGQYTGFTDMYGKEIYEGDIVIDKFGLMQVVEYNEELGLWETYEIDDKTDRMDLYRHYGMCKVTGNVYEKQLKGVISK
ncbi:MAG: hypothetical protein IJ790_00790 [Lachnospiraceae bacterium]|nr:hypothetical protein [Lachnospiraceae bacterium]